VKVPPVGVADRVTHDAVEQNGPIAVIEGVTLRIKTFNVTGVLVHPPGPVAVTEIPLVINPGEADDQFTPIWFVPCPEVIVPGAVTVHV
jgi:hypothetical protein